MKNPTTKPRRVHPAPPHLASLPAAVISLAALLTAEDQEVLSYLLSSNAAGRRSEPRRRRPHSPELGCACFSCYKSFWARWDASPNRHVIHAIIDAVEESAELGARRAGRRRRRSSRLEPKVAELAAQNSAAAPERLVDQCVIVEINGLDGGHVADDYGDDDDYEEEDKRSSVRRFVSFIGERVWGVWG